MSKKLDKSAQLSAVSPQGSSGDDRHLSQVVVSSLVPPFLGSCSSILQVAIFEEKFKMYSLRGGTLGFRECLGDVVVLRVSRILKEKASSLDAEGWLAGLYEAYKPRGTYELLDILRDIRCSASGEVNIDALLKYVVLFAVVVEKAKGVPVSRDEVFSIFIRGLKNEEFGEFLVSTGLKALPPKEWLEFVLDRADEFRQAQSICKGASGRVKKPFPTKFSGGQTRSAVGAVAAPPPSRAPSVGVSVPAVGSQGSVQDRRVWNENLCLGCGHVSNPPHRRVNCPHKHLPGWRSRGAPPSPPLAGVALVAQRGS